MWKKLFLAAAVLLIASTTLSVFSLLRLDRLEQSMTDIKTTTSRPSTPSVGQERLLQNYRDIRTQVLLRLGTGTDATLFITPDEPEISQLVQEVAGDFSAEDFWKDYIKLYRWVVINIDYTLDSSLPLLPESLDTPVSELYWEGDFWRLPVETLDNGRGDCEDMATLLVSMMLNYNQRRHPVWILGAITDNPRPKAHVAVAIPLQGAHLAIFDLSGRYYTPFEEVGGFGSQFFPQALEHWFKHLERTEMMDARIYLAFSEDFYREFQGNEEFSDWLYDFFIQSDAL
jgi:hypothetical protein